MGAGAFHGRVRNGIGCWALRRTTRSANNSGEKLVGVGSRRRVQRPSGCAGRAAGAATAVRPCGPFDPGREFVQVSSDDAFVSGRALRAARAASPTGRRSGWTAPAEPIVASTIGVSVTLNHARRSDGHGRMGGIKTFGRLVPVSFRRCRLSTPGLSTWWSATALIGSTRLEVRFPLRCLQRLSMPHIATLRCGWRHNRSTRGASIPVLSY
jgi:hypothetical protein